MIGRNILMYFPWSRLDEEGAPLGELDNRFGALFELRRLQRPKYENLADNERFNQGIAGFFDNILLQNYSLFREDMRIRSGNVVRIVERCTSDGKTTFLDGDFLDSVDILIIVSFDSQRTGQHPNESELLGIRRFLDDPGHTLFVCPHHGVRTFHLHPHLPHFEMLGDSPDKLDVLVKQPINLEAPPHPFVKQGRTTFDALLQSKPNVFRGRLLICDATLWTSTNGGLDSLRQFWSNVTRLA